MMKLCLGIKPTIDGAMVLVDDTAKVLNLWDIPMTLDGSVDTIRLLWNLKSMKHTAAKIPVFAAVEGFDIGTGGDVAYLSKPENIVRTSIKPYVDRIVSVLPMFWNDKVGLSGTDTSSLELAQEYCNHPLIQSATTEARADAYFVAVVGHWLLGQRKNFPPKLHSLLSQHS